VHLARSAHCYQQMYLLWFPPIHSPLTSSRVIQELRALPKPLCVGRPRPDHTCEEAGEDLLELDPVDVCVDMLEQQARRLEVSLAHC